MRSGFKRCVTTGEGYHLSKLKAQRRGGERTSLGELASRPTIIQRSLLYFHLEATLSTMTTSR